MKYVKALLVAFGLFAVLVVPALAKEYTKEQYLAMGGQTMSGTVTKVGVYNFFIKTADGEEVNIHTDSKKIQFVPEDERLMVGDKISFIYLAPESASRSIDKIMAYYIEFKEKVPRQFLTDGMTCVVSLSQRNEKACYLPDFQKIVSFEGRWPEKVYRGVEIRTSVGSVLTVELKTVPANIGNGYVYKLKDIGPYLK